MVAEAPAPPRPRLDPARLARAFGVVEAAVAAGEPPAAVLAVAGPDGPVRSWAFGSDDAGGRIGVEDRFLVASITKPIVVTAVLQLVEEGRLTLADPVQRWIPELVAPAVAEDRPGAEAITVWHLLTHTAGLTDLDWEGDDAPPSPEALLEGVCRRPLSFVPGTAYAYCSDSFFLLGLLLQRLGGHASTAEALRARILEPLGMAATGFEPLLDGRRSAPASLVGGSTEASAALVEWFGTVQHPGGGLWSTAHDLIAFGRAWLGSPAVPRVLSRPLRELAGREQTAGIWEAGDPPRRPTYGLGWGKSTLDGRMPGSPAEIDHAGATGSRLWVDPGHGLVIALLVGRWGSDRRLSDAAVAAVYGALDESSG